MDFYFRSYKNKELIDRFTEKELGLLHPKHTGIPESYGIFYALGAALMFEGKKKNFYNLYQELTNYFGRNSKWLLPCLSHRNQLSVRHNIYVLHLSSRVSEGM